MKKFLIKLFRVFGFLFAQRFVHYLMRTKRISLQQIENCVNINYSLKTYAKL